MPKKHAEEEVEGIEEDVQTEDNFSILDLVAAEIEEVKGFSCVEDGEYDLTLVSMQATFSKKRNPIIVAKIEIGIDDPDARVGMITERLNLPYRGCTKNQRDFFSDKVAEFRIGWGIEAEEFTELVQGAFQDMAATEPRMTSIEITEYNGRLERAIVEYVDEEKDPESGKTYPPRNRVKQYL